MDQNKILSALCYISLLFAPFLLPLIVYFIVKDTEVRYHAKRAFISHLVPTLFILILMIFGFIGIFSASNNGINGFVNVMYFLMAMYFIVTIGILIWNFVQAFRVIR